eukprot:TRINITY_DN33302_c0_g1_i3.p1 TRINITY_DN33302_c0_g1~~TRINITY_DN33302_c0_g1_i3.p1  ORF type:complete len:121 (-),score=18.68 TRINITY_DN33302_c0_g1_i3:102-464(-)
MTGQRPLKRKALPTEQPAPESTAEDWEGQPRLKRHVHKLLMARDPSAVLVRYRSCCESLEREVLMRYSVHVAAWVALLPDDNPLLPDCSRLLAHYLSARKRVHLSPWLRGCLHLVARSPL